MRLSCSGFHNEDAYCTRLVLAGLALASLPVAPSDGLSGCFGCLISSSRDRAHTPKFTTPQFSHNRPSSLLSPKHCSQVRWEGRAALSSSVRAGAEPFISQTGDRYCVAGETQNKRRRRCAWFTGPAFVCLPTYEAFAFSPSLLEERLLGRHS